MSLGDAKTSGNQEQKPRTAIASDDAVIDRVMRTKTEIEIFKALRRIPESNLPQKRAPQKRKTATYSHPY